MYSELPHAGPSLLFSLGVDDNNGVPAGGDIPAKLCKRDSMESVLVAPLACCLVPIGLVVDSLSGVSTGA